MKETDRRTLLKELGLTGLLGLAGCQELPEPTPTHTTSESTTATNKPHITIDATLQERDDSRSLLITGSVSAQSNVIDVVVVLDDSRHRQKFDPAKQTTFEFSVAVTGGRSYNVTATAKTAAGDQLTTQTSTGYIPRAVDGLTTTRLVGAHYYPWYEMDSGHENWTERCIETPALGEYASDDPAVIDHHLTWCLNHGINWLSISWWGEDSGTDRALSNALLDAEMFEQIEFSILYETTRLKEFDYDLDTDTALERLRTDLQYLEAHYFSVPNYLHFDDRPVVFFWIAHALRGDVESAFQEITSPLTTTSTC